MQVSNSIRLLLNEFEFQKIKMSTSKPYSTKLSHLVDMNDYVGKELGLTDWVQVTQDAVNQFAKLTEDEQWIHVDVEKSAKHSPYKKTVAHGFMVLSFASKFCYECFSVDDVTFGVNYGLNKVRFMSPTPSDARFRGRISLMDYMEIEGGARYILKVIFEVEGVEKPACVAEFVAQAYT